MASSEEPIKSAQWYPTRSFVKCENADFVNRYTLMIESLHASKRIDSFMRDKGLRAVSHVESTLSDWFPHSISESESALPGEREGIANSSLTRRAHLFGKKQYQDLLSPSASDDDFEEVISMSQSQIDDGDYRSAFASVGAALLAFCLDFGLTLEDSDRAGVVSSVMTHHELRAFCINTSLYLGLVDVAWDIFSEKRGAAALSDAFARLVLRFLSEGD